MAGLADSITNLIAAYGRPMTVRREVAAAGANAWTEGSLTVSYFPAVGKERNSTPTELIGAITDELLDVRLDASTITTAPTKLDRLAFGAFTGDGGATWMRIVNVVPVAVGAVVVAYDLQVRR